MQKELKFSLSKLGTHMSWFLNILTVTIIWDITDTKDFTWAQPTGTLHRRKIHELLLSKTPSLLVLELPELWIIKGWKKLEQLAQRGGRCPRLGWTGVWATCFSWRRPCSLQGCWTRWALKVPFKTNSSMILWEGSWGDTIVLLHCSYTPLKASAVDHHRGQDTSHMTFGLIQHRSQSLSNSIM